MGPHWFAFALLVAIVWDLLRLIGTIDGEKAAAKQQFCTRLVLVAALVYLVLWALGSSGPFVAWR